MTAERLRLKSIETNKILKIKAHNNKEINQVHDRILEQKRLAIYLTPGIQIQTRPTINIKICKNHLMVPQQNDVLH